MTTRLRVSGIGFEVKNSRFGVPGDDAACRDPSGSWSVQFVDVTVGASTRA